MRLEGPFSTTKVVAFDSHPGFCFAASGVGSVLRIPLGLVGVCAVGIMLFVVLKVPVLEL